VEFAMIQILAHITEYELPGFWLAALAGFIGGVAVTVAMLARKLK
jgi:hypothetical protein